MLAQKNLERCGNLADWKIPTPHELWQMIADKTFPFQSGDDRRINGHYYRCVDNGGLAGKDLDDYGDRYHQLPRRQCFAVQSRARAAEIFRDAAKNS